MDLWSFDFRPEEAPPFVSRYIIQKTVILESELTHMYVCAEKEHTLLPSCLVHLNISCSCLTTQPWELAPLLYRRSRDLPLSVRPFPCLQLPPDCAPSLFCSQNSCSGKSVCNEKLKPFAPVNAARSWLSFGVGLGFWMYIQRSQCNERWRAFDVYSIWYTCK